MNQVTFRECKKCKHGEDCEHNPKKNRVEKYIQVFKHANSASGLTEIYFVWNTKSSNKIGEIRWWGAFRKYCFFPNSDTLYDHDCLRFIADYLATFNKAHYDAAKTRRSASRMRKQKMR